MSQSISNLNIDDHICIRETIDGVASDVLLRIICTPETNPYGDYYFVVREYATGKGSTESNLKFNNTSTEVDYENSLLDQFMTGEYTERLDEATLACIATSTITCFNYAESASYTIARKIFAMSNKELGGNYTLDESLSLGYFTSNALRKTLNKVGTAVYVWTRSPASASAVCCVDSYGYLFTSSPTSSYFARPAFNLLSSCLVASEPNEDGSYNLVTDAEIPPRTAGFEVLMGETATRPKEIKVECEAVYNGTLAASVCNNYKDEDPTWESITLGAAHEFTNVEKTANTWAVGVKIEAESESNIIIYEPFGVVLCEEA